MEMSRKKRERTGHISALPILKNSSKEEDSSTAILAGLAGICLGDISPPLCSTKLCSAQRGFTQLERLEAADFTCTPAQLLLCI